jgi:hypothetical protein
MANLQLNILVVPTYSTLTLAIADASIYPSTPPVLAPFIEIDIPGFGIKILPFICNTINVFTSATLGITEEGCTQPIPDGVYRFKYSVAPANENYVERSILRVEKLQEKFDSAFLQLDMMECDMALKTQSSVTLNTINFFIQGAIAAANNCAENESMTLYSKADNMLNNFLRTNCGCSGNNYQINFK